MQNESSGVATCGKWQRHSQFPNIHLSHKKITRILSILVIHWFFNRDPKIPKLHEKNPHINIWVVTMIPPKPTSPFMLFHCSHWHHTSHYWVPMTHWLPLPTAPSVAFMTATLGSNSEVLASELKPTNSRGKLGRWKKIAKTDGIYFSAHFL